MNAFFSSLITPLMYFILLGVLHSCPVHAMLSAVRSGFLLCLKVTLSVITLHIHAYSCLASWNPFLIGIFFFLVLIERREEAALNWLPEMSLSYQELVFCCISPTESLKFDEDEKQQCSQMCRAFSGDLCFPFRICWCEISHFLIWFEWSRYPCSKDRVKLEPFRFFPAAGPSPLLKYIRCNSCRCLHLHRMGKYLHAKQEFIQHHYIKL